MIKYEKFSITSSGYRGHVEALAWLGIPPEKAALEIKARAPPDGGPALPLGRTTQLTEEKLSEARTHSMAVTPACQGEKLSNLCRALHLANIPNLLKDCQLPRVVLAMALTFLN